MCFPFSLILNSAVPLPGAVQCVLLQNVAWGFLFPSPPTAHTPAPLRGTDRRPPPLPEVRGPSPSASRRRGRGAPPCPSLPRFELARSACAAPFEPTHMPPVTALPRSTRDDSHVAQNDCTIIVRTFSLLGEKGGEGVVFSRPLRARRRESSESLSNPTPSSRVLRDKFEQCPRHLPSCCCLRLGYR